MGTTVEGMKLTRRGEPEILFWVDMAQGGLMLVEGDNGSGKSLFLATMGWKMKKFFNKTICMDFHPEPAFGDYKYMGDAELLEELQAINIKAKTKAEQIAEGEVKFGKWAESGPGSYLRDSVWLLQEGYRYFERRRPADKLGMLYGYLVQQKRHFGMLMAVEATNVNLLDDFRFIPRIDFWVKCSWFGQQHTAVYQIENRRLPLGHPLKFKGLTIDAKHWGQLYDTRNPINMREKWLKGVL